MKGQVSLRLLPMKPRAFWGLGTSLSLSMMIRLLPRRGGGGGARPDDGLTFPPLSVTPGTRPSVRIRPLIPCFWPHLIKQPGDRLMSKWGALFCAALVMIAAGCTRPPSDALIAADAQNRIGADQRIKAPQIR